MHTIGKLLLAGGLLASTAWTGKQPVLKSGTYRAAIARPDGQQIVFNLVAKDSAGKKVLYVLNASERLLVDSVSVKDDSLVIQMPFFESAFKVAADNAGNLNGFWIKQFGDRRQVLPFTAVYNSRQRFAATAKPRFSAAGRWDATFTGSDNDTYKAIGEFKQQGNHVTGTFRTTTGDYRYLEGVVNGDSLVLSAFDGGHAFLFTGRLANNNTITGGQFYSSAKGQETWVARRDSNIDLPDGYQQTRLHEGESRLNFTFTSTGGQQVSINDARYKNKVVIVQLLGSWCPNCMDETAFLSDYYNRNRDRGVEVIGLAYERTTDFEQSKRALARFQKRFDVQYPVLVTGVAVSDKQRAEKTLPQLMSIEAFPTSIYIDKKGTVRKIYSGFDGPATGEHYEAFKKHFSETVNGLLSE